MIGPSGPAPDLMERVIAYRHFTLARANHDYYLKSPYQDDRWDTPEKHARCHAPLPISEDSPIVLDGIQPKAHPAPHPGCRCGIYAYYEPRLVREPRYDRYGMGYNDPAEVLALVTLAGRMEVHVDGMRAQTARIEALGYCDWWADEKKAGLVQIATALGVPAVPQGQLQALSTEYGQPLPDSLKPAVPEEKPKPATDDPREAIRREVMAAMRPKPSRRLPRFLWSANVVGNLGVIAWLGLPNATVSGVCALFGAWMLGREYPTKAV